MRLYEVIITNTRSTDLYDRLSTLSYKISDRSEVTITSYFHDNIDLDDLILKIRTEEPLANISVNVLYENNWIQFIRDPYNSIDISPNIIIKPSWDTTYSDKIVIRMDKGKSFGDGNHETTQMCCMLLEKYINKGESVLDVGTGSGILSIVASKLEASRIVALDTSPISIREAQDNTIKNSVSNIDFCSCRIEEYRGSKFNLIVANIITDVIISISSKVELNLNPGGICILSAIEVDKYDEVLSIYNKLGFTLLEDMKINKWCTMVFKLVK